MDRYLVFKAAALVCCLNWSPYLTLHIMDHVCLRSTLYTHPEGYPERASSLLTLSSPTFDLHPHKLQCATLWVTTEKRNLVVFYVLFFFLESFKLMSFNDKPFYRGQVHNVPINILNIVHVKLGKCSRICPCGFSPEIT